MISNNHHLDPSYISVLKMEQLLVAQSASKNPLDGIDNNPNPRISVAQYFKHSQIYPS